MAQRANRKTRAAIVVATVIVLFGLPFLTWLASVYTDYLWYVDLGQRSVFIVRIVSSLAFGLAFGIAAFGLLFVNARIARRMAPRAMLTSVGTMPPQVEEVILQIRASIGPILDRVILWGSLAVALLVGINTANQWVPLRIALAAGPFGIQDPQFGRDVGFFVFTLPALRIVSNWLTGDAHPDHGGHVRRAPPRWRDPAVGEAARVRSARQGAPLGALRADRAFEGFRLLARHLVPRLLAERPGHRRFVRGRARAVAGAPDPDRRSPSASVSRCSLNIRSKGWRLPLIALGVWVVASILVGDCLSRDRAAVRREAQ